MAKKKSHEETIRSGLKELRKLGVSVDGGSPALVSRLREQLGKGRNVELAVVFTLGKIADATAVEALADLERAATDKEVQREIRRSLYKLAQKGIAAPPPENGGAALQRPILGLAPEIESYLSSVDGAGGRLVWLAKPQAGSGIQLLQGMASDREGLLQASGALIRRKELRRMAEEIRKSHGIAMISIPWEYGDQILYEGYEKAKGPGRSGTEHFPSLRAIFNPAKPKSFPHPIYGLLESGGLRSGAGRDLSHRLLEEPELQPWILDEDWVQPYLRQVEEAQGSRLVLNEFQKEERFSGIVRDAVREIFYGENQQLFQRRMEDTALYLFKTGREEQAGLALTVALEIKEGNVGGLDISFLTGWIQKSLAFYLGQAKAKAAEEPSLILKP